MGTPDAVVSKIVKIEYIGFKTNMATTLPDAPFDLFVVDNWPLVNVNLCRPPCSDLEIDKFQARFCSMLSLARTGSARVPKGRLSLSMNLNGIVEASFPQQLRAASFIGEVKEYVKDSISATALIVENESARVILEIIMKLQPLQSKHCVFSNADDAEKWLMSIASGDQSSSI